MTDKEQSSSGSRQRIDKWLFFARMSKTRTLAQAHIQSGNVRINGEHVVQPAHQVKAGDKIELRMERRTLILVVKLPGSRRGPFDEARLLYEDLTPPADETKRLTRLEQAVRIPGSGRPTKKERRAMDRLTDSED